jgi:outer membrane protein assembly factor BamD (BamD/ComL family)
MRTIARLVLCAAALALVVPAHAQTATELKKELLPKIKKAQADGKDLGEAAEEYKQGDKALSDGMQDEAIEHFKKAKESMPKE